MPELFESRAALWIQGDDLDPDEVSRLLDCVPDRAYRKGEQVPTKIGHLRNVRTGFWEKCTPRHQPENLEAQIYELLEGMTENLAVWQELSTRFRIILRSSLFMNKSFDMGGFDLGPGSVRLLGLRGIGLDIDIWGGADDGSQPPI